jgi:hypothetical protein
VAHHAAVWLATSENGCGDRKSRPPPPPSHPRTHERARAATHL